VSYFEEQERLKYQAGTGQVGLFYSEHRPKSGVARNLHLKVLDIYQLFTQAEHTL